MMRQLCICNGSIQAGQIVYASQLGGHYVTSSNANPKDNPPIGVALNDATQGEHVQVQLYDHQHPKPIPAEARCTNIGGAFIGGMKRMQCDLPEGHAGNHKHGDFGWTDAKQEALDKKIAADSQATLDRELGLLDEMLADVRTTSDAKIYTGVDMGVDMGFVETIPASDAFAGTIADAEKAIAKLILGEPKP